MSGGSKTSVTTTKPWDIQVPYLKGGFKQAQKIYDANKGLGPEYYDKPSLAGFTDLEKQSQTGVANYLRGPRPAAMQAGAEDALLRGMKGQVDTSAYAPMVNALQQQVTSNLTGKILPGIRESLVRYQPGGSTRGDLVQNKAISGAVTSGMTAPLAQMYTDAYGKAKDRSTEWGRQYPGIMDAPLSGAAALGEVGAQQRAMQQEKINRDMAKYQYEATAPQQTLANYMSMISGNYGGTTSQTVPGQGIMGTLGSLASIVGPGGLGLFGSDIRIKENIVPDGTIYNGHNVYHFNYINDDVRRRGVMAQEVEQTNPDAVVEIDGIKYVNYEAL